MKFALLLATPLQLAATLAFAAPPITVAWSEKPPYYYIEDGMDKGFMLAYGKTVFAAAGIDASFVREPQKRIWSRFRTGTRNYCSIGWYHLAERTAIAQYSLPIYTDPSQMVLIAPKSVAQVQAHATLASMLADPTLTLGLLDGSSYGAELDARIKDSANRKMLSSVNSVGMMQMVAADRVSYMLSDRTDWNYTRIRHRSLDNVVQYEVPDVPPGLKRHIVCSKDIPAATMEKLNQAIRITPKPVPQER
ncbi:substrate-binding periplasmic protein [Pseudoduganella aquatica]|uniref:Transporter substrate-binding domain-containing protein n=1 Tax=Pseudoduganella aquatica TaxID=2660641 RepID=A0A7X4KM27_9BURK|nr:transporter substrate-binding domain-containing protein [Pseudoduganella aquatica]MYN07752.1 transporter substrate-binding domain-containing protein [Pseudoduganella aquatica]